MFKIGFVFLQSCASKMPSLWYSCRILQLQSNNAEIVLVRARVWVCVCVCVHVAWERPVGCNLLSSCLASQHNGLGINKPIKVYWWNSLASTLQQSDCGGKVQIYRWKTHHSEAAKWKMPAPFKISLLSIQDCRHAQCVCSVVEKLDLSLFFDKLSLVQFTLTQLLTQLPLRAVTT